MCSNFSRLPDLLPLPSSPPFARLSFPPRNRSVCPSCVFTVFDKPVVGVRWMFAVTVCSPPPVNPPPPPPPPRLLFPVPPLRLCSSPSPACSLTFRLPFICSVFKKTKTEAETLAQSIQTDVSDEIFIPQNCNLVSALACLVEAQPGRLLLMANRLLSALC